MITSDKNVTTLERKVITGEKNVKTTLGRKNGLLWSKTPIYMDYLD